MHLFLVLNSAAVFAGREVSITAAKHLCAPAGIHGPLVDYAVEGRFKHLLCKNHDTFNSCNVGNYLYYFFSHSSDFVLWCEGHLYGKPSAVARPRARSGMCNSSHSAPRIVLWMPHQAPSPLPSFFPTVHPEGRKHLSPPLFCRGPEMRRLRVGTCCSLLRRNRRGEERIHTWSLRSSIHPHKKAFRLRRIGALGARPQSLLGGERWNGARGGPSFLRRDSLLLSFLFSPLFLSLLVWNK